MTIKDLARLADVSYATVSRSLNNSPLVKEETKQKILTLAKENSFELNSGARSLVTRKTGTVGIIFPESLDNDNNSFFSALLLKGIRNELEYRGLDALIAFPCNTKTGESNAVRWIRQHKVDGIYLIDPKFPEGDYLSIRNTPIPVVFVHFKPRFAENHPLGLLYTNHTRGGYLAVKHLLDQGFRRIFTFTERERQFQERTEGYRLALREYGQPVLEERIFSDDATKEGGRRLITANRKLWRKGDALFIQADITAVGAIKALEDLGWEVPGDIAVVGYDNIELGSLFEPSLTTVRQPTEEMAAAACRLLFERMDSHSPSAPREELLNPELIIRESSQKNCT